MKRFFSKIACFFWSWGFLKFILWTLTLVILLYVEEDWRGARAWAATKAKWEGKGETFDPARFIPPPVPDDQNLAAIPAFKLEPTKDAKGNSYLDDVALRKATANFDQEDFPPVGNWRKGEPPNLDKIHRAISVLYVKAFKSAPPSSDSLAQLDLLFPFIADLRAAAVRPCCRFQYDDTQQMPASRGLGLIVGQIKVSRILTIHAMLELENHRPDLALEDLKIIFRLADGAQRDSTLVAALVKMGMISISSAAIYDGLTQHLWSDDQLAEIDHLLEPINFLADYQFAMRSEAMESVANIDYFKKNAHLSDLDGFVEMVTGMSDGPYSLAKFSFIPGWPGGWWDDNKCQMATFLFQSLTTVDPRARRVFPRVDLDLHHEEERAKGRWDAIAPWNLWFTIAVGPVDAATQKFAQAQVWVDETRIACALERYRLAYDVYPESLDVLSPGCIAAVPHDILNGDIYHYQLRPDGMFLLYSLGWNQIDDGGKVVYKTDNPNMVDYNAGDWVWPTPQVAATK